MNPCAGRLLTWSNGLTLARLLAAPFFFLALRGEAPLLAFVLFWGAVATDVAEGRIARARGESSPLGGLFDHATDAIFVSSGLVALALADIVPAVLPLLVGCAFLQYVMDSRSLEGHALRASFLGRWNGILYFLPLGIVASREGLGLAVPSDGLVRALGAALVASTGFSMLDRAWTLWRVRADAASNFD